MAPVADDTLIQQPPASPSELFTCIPITLLSQPSMPVTHTWHPKMPWNNAPSGLIRRFRYAFDEELRYHLLQPMRNIERMLIDRNGGNHKAASAQAESMEQEELLGWLRDPRTYVKGWWRDTSSEHLTFAKTETLDQRVHGNKRPHAFDDEVEDGPMRKQRKLDSTLSTDIAISEGLVSSIPNMDRRFELPNAMPSEADIEKCRTFSLKGSDFRSVPSIQQKLSSAVIGIITASWFSATEDLRRCRCGICLRQARKEQEEDDRRKAEKAAEREKERKLAELKLLMTIRVETKLDHRQNGRTDQAEHPFPKHDYLDPLEHMDDDTEDELDELDSYSDESEELVV